MTVFSLCLGVFVAILSGLPGLAVIPPQADLIMEMAEDLINRL